MSKLTHIFSSVLGIPESAVGPATSPDTTPSWDSLNAIILLTEIEKAFDQRFGYEEAMAVKSLADVRALLTKKGLNPDA
ncbi:MAG: acyl carrier protein [Patescibacteria group bacterium]